MSKNVCVHPTTRSSVSSPRGAVAVHAPSRGRAQVLHSGQPGMNAGLAAHGHGWPIAAGPRSRTGARACRALARHRTTGARALGYLALVQVTRRQGGTLGGRYSSNGYVHQKENGRLSGRHRWQASCHRGMCTPGRTWSAVRPPSLASQLPQGNVYTRKKMVGCQTAFAGRPAPTGGTCTSEENGRP